VAIHSPNASLGDRIRQLPAFEFSAELAVLEQEIPLGLPLLERIIEQGIVPKDLACKLYADFLGIAYVDPFASLITDEAVQAIPAEIAKKVQAIGLYFIDGVLTAAFSAPEDAARVKRLSQIIKQPVSPVFALPRDIDDVILIQYSNETDISSEINELSSSSVFNNPELAEAEPLIKIFDDIVYYAIRERATDIHIEAQDNCCRLRLRIDGMLREVLTYSRKLHRAIIARIKILCNLNIAETRIPQDGRFSMKIGYCTANFRVSTIPAQFGEKSVIRILAMSGRKSIITLEKMMMSQSVLIPFRRLIQNPNGILFVTGPTGSGKTTTLYAALNELNTPDKNISTIEDPIEIQVEGITQTQVNAQIDLRFSTVLRSLLRQDPDIILIGEIRDLETAKIATEAALTGHMVFATLHTNSAAQAIVRLLEIGVAPYLVAPSIVGVLAQRLAARICDNCKESYYPPRELLLKFFKEDGLTDVPFYRGRGCRVCRGTGYKGRVAIHELVLITEEIRTLITTGASVQQITASASKVGFKPLRYDGLKKVLLGLTTIEEVEANTSFEWEF
jgi:type IV pilus assembly protein PilB